VFVDEAHSASSPCFARVINTTNSYYRVALTATPERKDGMHVVMFDVMGPVVTRGITEQLPVHVKVVHTGVTWPISGLQGNAFWAQLLGQITKHEGRNALICARVLADARAGHSVLVCTDRVRHIHVLVDMLRDQDQKYCEKFGKKPLHIGKLYGDVKGKDRRDIRLQAKSGQLNIVVAYSKIVQLGWNVPAWSSIHSVMPMSNEPNWYQRVSRIRTKCQNCPGVTHPDCLKKGLCRKRPPVAHVYVDKSRLAEGCFSTQHNVHERLGFVEQHLHEDASVNPIQRDPNRKGKSIKWSEMR
jgi:superfamily II DNA or RNA helicase